jgi:hypothetical protein
VESCGDLDRARKENRHLCAQLAERDEVIAERDQQLVEAHERIDELERVEELRAALKMYLCEVEDLMSRDELEALGYAQLAFLDLLDMIESNPEECRVEPPELLEANTEKDKKGKKKWKMKPTSTGPAALSKGKEATLPPAEELIAPIQDTIALSQAAAAAGAAPASASSITQPRGASDEPPKK